MRIGVWTGGLVASALAGVLVGFGSREGAPALAFAALGHLLLSERATMTAAVTAGVIVHVAWIVAWCMTLALLVGRVRGMRLVTVAVLSGAAMYVLALTLFQSLDSGINAGWSQGHLLAAVLAFSVSFAVGMRLAPSNVTRQPRTESV
jgi:hypothetical protein